MLGSLIPVHNAKEHDPDTSTKGATGQEKCYIHAEKFFIIFFHTEKCYIHDILIINFIINLMFNC